MIGTKRIAGKSTDTSGFAVKISTVFTSIALATTLGLSALAAGSKPLPIEKIGLDRSKQFVILFAEVPGLFPAVPNVLDLPGPNHRVVIEFTDATIDKASMPAAEQLATSMNKSLPAVKSLRYYNIANALKPTARVVFDVPESVKVVPRVVKLEENSVTISFGDDFLNFTNAAKTAAKGGAPVPALGENKEPETTVAPEAQPVATAVVAATQPVAAVPARSALDMPAPSAATQTPVASTTIATPDAVTTSSAADVAPALRPAEPITQGTIENSPTAFAMQNPASTEGQTSVETTAPAKAEVSMGDAINGAMGATSSAPGIVKQTTTETTASSGTPGTGWDWTQSSAGQPAKTADAGSGSMFEHVNPTTSTPETTTTTSTSSKPDDVLPTAAQADAAVNADKGGANATESAVLPTASTNSVTAGSAPADENTTKQAAVKLYNTAVRSHLTGNLSDAIANYKAALAVFPHLEEAHSNLGLIYNQQHSYAEALNEFHKALAINPKDAISYNGIGAALRAQKDLLGAIKNWQTAVDLDPKLATAHYNLGTAYEIQREYDKALEAYKDAVHHDFRLGEAYYRMGLIMQRKHQPVDAESQFKEALKISANSEYSDDARKQLALLKQKKN